MRSLFFIAVIVTATIGSVHADDAPVKAPAPIYCEKGKLIFSEDFASGAIDKSWRRNHGKWTVKDGIVRGDEVPADNHPAVLRHELVTHNFVAEFGFRFDGGKAILLIVNDKSAHVCKLRIEPSLFEVIKDKTRTLETQRQNLTAGEWHTALVEVCGKIIIASIDGKFIAWGSHDGIDVDKASMAFDVGGAGVSIKSVRFWEAKLPADPAAALKNLQTLHPKTDSAASK